MKWVVTALAAHPFRDEMIAGTDEGGKVQVIAPYRAKSKQAVDG